jgi:hypothetical protein
VLHRVAFLQLTCPGAFFSPISSPSHLPGLHLCLAAHPAYVPKRKKKRLNASDREMGRHMYQKLFRVRLCLRNNSELCLRAFAAAHLWYAPRA